jgi:arylsulfatase A-like enzyme
MNRRSFCAGLSAAALLPGSTRAAFAAPQRRQPNIVYILADDLGWGDLDVYNPHSAAPTPVMDGFARQGMRFTDMHSSDAVCTPSRYGILTGRYCWRSRLKKGVLGGDAPNLIEEGRLTVPGMLQKAGYYTAGVGKWHLGLGTAQKADFSKPLLPGPVSHGFHYFYGIPASLDMAPYLYFENDRVVEAATIADPGSTAPRGVTWRGGLRAPHFDIPQVLPNLTDKAVNIVREHAGASAPYFLYFAMPAPHTPWVPLEEYRGKSRAGAYGDYVCEVDAMIGRILDAVQSSGQVNDTIVVVTSDNGAIWGPEDIEHYPHRANAEWRGQKADIWEAGHRIPFMVRWPGRIAPSSVCEETVSLVDLMATLADVLGIDLPPDAGEDSFSNLPIWLGRRHGPVRTSTIDHSNDGMFTIREGDWKLELGLGSGGFSLPRTVEPVADGVGGQLYNLKDDPREVYNLWAARPDIVERLSGLLNRYRSSGRTRN